MEETKVYMQNNNDMNCPSAQKGAISKGHKCDLFETAPFAYLIVVCPSVRSAHRISVAPDDQKY